MWEPFGTQPANSTAYWRAAPSERGTFSILSTCILTLLLCVHTCLHLNIPVHKITKWHQRPWILRTFGILVGLLAPEIVAFMAFRQWLWARKLEDAMKEPIGKLIEPAYIKTQRSGRSGNRRLADDVEYVAEDCSTGAEFNTTEPLTDATNRRKRNPWTRVHSHFALMGGFAFEADHSMTNFLPAPYTRLTLTPHALRKLAEIEPMLIPDISAEAIKDKSKANWLAKGLVCLQTCWFIVQVIGRACISAPISLLEMSTFLHALCCLVIYCAWWHKPLEIGEPELIPTTTEHNRKICAWLIMSGYLGARRPLSPDPRPYSWRQGFLVHREDLYKKGTSEMAAEDFDESHLSKPEASSSTESPQLVKTVGAHSRSCKLYPGQIANGHYLILRNPGRDQEERWKYSGSECIMLDAATLECLRLADLLRTDSDNKDVWAIDWSKDRSRPDRKRVLLPHISDFEGFADPKLDGFKGSTKLTQRLNAQTFFWATLLFAGSIYGLVHLIAWNGPFTTLTQRWMWRVSCFIIASPSVVAIIVLLVIYIYDYVNHKVWAYFVFAPIWLLSKIASKIFPTFSVQQTVALAIMTIILSLVYVAARMYVIVECFINISQLPPEVYQVPPWTQYIPHLGAG